ncbi:TPA: hypothetical protein ACHSDZ_004056 [Pseudomonas aeruginosa]
MNKAPVEQAGANVGHGHVFPRADGVKMRCGGPALCSECAADAYRARATLAQPSPAQELERPEVAEVAFVLRNIGAMDAEDIDGDNVDLRFEDAEGRDTGCDVSIVEYAEKAADLLEQHDRIVGELRAEIAMLRSYEAEWELLLNEHEQQRDAALAEVAGLRSLLNSLLCYVERDINRMRSDRDKSDNKEIYDRSISLAMERLKAAQNAVFTTEPGCDTAVELAAQTTQAQHSVPDDDMILQIFADNAEHSEQGDEHGYCIVREQHAQAIARKLLAAAPGNSAQHSVPEGLALIPVRETEAMHDAVMALLYKGVARTDTQKLLDAYIAAAPGKEGV